MSYLPSASGSQPTTPSLGQESTYRWKRRPDKDSESPEAKKNKMASKDNMETKWKIPLGNKKQVGTLLPTKLQETLGLTKNHQQE